MATKIEQISVRLRGAETPARFRTDRRHRLLSRLLRLPTDEDVAREKAVERAAESRLPELFPPDDPERLAYEAELRAIGVTPARVWNFPVRKPIRKPGWRDWIRNRLGG